MTSWPPYGTQLLRLADVFPPPAVLAELLCAGTRSDLEVLASLWVTEGIPHAFVEHPALYEHMRRELGERLRVSPKNVSMTGSRRIGYSMRPDKWGKPPGPKSDFDLFVVDRVLFERVVKDFHRWVSDFREGRSVPQSTDEKKWWPGNAERGPFDIKRGFLAPLWRIPRKPQYSTVDRIGAALTETRNRARRLATHLGVGELLAAEEPLRLRVYRDWRRAVDGVRCSLTAAGCKLGRQSWS